MKDLGLAPTSLTKKGSVCCLSAPGFSTISEGVVLSAKHETGRPAAGYTVSLIAKV